MNSKEILNEAYKNDIELYKRVQDDILELYKEIMAQFTKLMFILGNKNIITSKDIEDFKGDDEVHNMINKIVDEAKEIIKSNEK